MVKRNFLSSEQNRRRRWAHGDDFHAGCRQCVERQFGVRACVAKVIYHGTSLLDELIYGRRAVTRPDNFDVRHQGMVSHGEIDLLYRIECRISDSVAERSQIAKGFFRSCDRKAKMMEGQFS